MVPVELLEGSILIDTKSGGRGGSTKEVAPEVAGARGGSMGRGADAMLPAGLGGRLGAAKAEGPWLAVFQCTGGVVTMRRHIFSCVARRGDAVVLCGNTRLKQSTLRWDADLRYTTFRLNWAS